MRFLGQNCNGFANRDLELGTRVSKRGFRLFNWKQLQGSGISKDWKFYGVGYFITLKLISILH